MIDDVDGGGDDGGRQRNPSKDNDSAGVVTLGLDGTTLTLVLQVGFYDFNQDIVIHVVAITFVQLKRHETHQDLDARSFSTCPITTLFANILPFLHQTKLPFRFPIILPPLRMLLTSNPSRSFPDCYPLIEIQ